MYTRVGLVLVVVETYTLLATAGLDPPLSALYVGLLEPPQRTVVLDCVVRGVEILGGCKIVELKDRMLNEITRRRGELRE